MYVGVYTPRPHSFWSLLPHVCLSSRFPPCRTNVPFTTPHGVATPVPAWARLPVAAHQRAAGPSARRATGGSGGRYRPPRPVRGTVGRPNERGETATNSLVRSQDSWREHHGGAAREPGYGVRASVTRGKTR